MLSSLDVGYKSQIIENQILKFFSNNLTWQHSAPQRDAISKNHVTAIQPVTINLT
jgi:hypothetical protein